VVVIQTKKEPKALFSFDYQIELTFDRTAILPCLVSVYREETLPEHTIKLGFFGGAGEPDLSDVVGIGVNNCSLKFAERTGRYIGNHNRKYEPKILPITGAAPGNPHAFAEAAAKLGTWCVGLSPFYDEDHHLHNGSDTSNYAVIVYMGLDRSATFETMRGKQRMNVQFALRDGYNILGIHAGIYCGGSRGTLQELADNLQCGKDVALARGTGGVAGYYSEFDRKIKKNTGSHMIVSSNPGYIIRKLIALQKQRWKQNGKMQRLFIDDVVQRTNQRLR